MTTPQIAQPHFAEPGWLWFGLLAFLGIVALQIHAARKRKQQLGQLSDPSILQSLIQSHSPVRRMFKNTMLLLATAGIGISLARPQWGEQTETVQSLGEDILFLLDCSKSMLATDTQPNRLGRAKYAILDFLQKQGHGRVGLVAFAGQAFLQCPLTFDYEAFQESLMAVDDKTIPVLGTDIGRALDEAYLSMEKDKRRKVMILLTDGEDLEKGGMKLAGELAKKEVIIFTVGVGTPQGAFVHFINEQGVMQQARDNNGQPVVSRLDEPVLKAIATATGGSYQPLGLLGEGMNKVQIGIEASSKLISSSQARKSSIDRYHYFLAVVTFLLVTESLLGTRKKIKPLTNP